MIPNARKTTAFPIALILCITTVALAQSQSFDVNPTEDTFTREQAPTLTFGGSGAFHIAGAAAQNAAGNMQGAADAFVRFDTAAAAAFFNEQFGRNSWNLISATLTLDEVGSPQNGIFSRGVGTFNIIYLANDNWSEGDGKPSSQAQATGNELGFDAGLALLSDLADANLGSFQNTGANGNIIFELNTAFEFALDVASGGIVTLYFSATDANTGATFHSVNRGNAGEIPVLTLVAEPLVDDMMDDGDMMPDDDMMNNNIPDDNEPDDGMAGDDDVMDDDMTGEPMPDDMQPMLCAPGMGMVFVTLSVCLLSLRLHSRRRRLLRK